MDTKYLNKYMFNYRILQKPNSQIQAINLPAEDNTDIKRIKGSFNSKILKILSIDGTLRFLPHPICSKTSIITSFTVTIPVYDTTIAPH